MEFFEKKSSIFNIFKGVIVSFLFTLVTLAIYSTILVYTDLSENTVKPVIITLTGISILIGSSMGTRKLKKNGLLNGGIIGAIYILIIYLLSSILNMDFSINVMTAIMIGVGLVGGILGRNNRSKYLKIYDFKAISIVLKFFQYNLHS